MYQVVDYRRDLGANPSFMNHDTEGFSLHMEAEKIREGEREAIAQALEKAANKVRRKSHQSVGLDSSLFAALFITQKPRYSGAFLYLVGIKSLTR